MAGVDFKCVNITRQIQMDIIKKALDEGVQNNRRVNAGEIYTLTKSLQYVKIGVKCYRDYSDGLVFEAFIE